MIPEPGRVATSDLPARALLRRHADHGAYADCFVIELAALVPLRDYVAAFYATPLFKMERWLLHRLANRPSTDGDVLQLADGTATSFAAWRVEERLPDQLLMGDFTGRTKSWLMTEPVAGQGPRTLLYFGSVIVPRVDAETGERSMGIGFHALLGFHKLYSRMLLRAAARRVRVQA